MCASLFGGRSDPVSFFAGVYAQTAKKSSVCCAESKVRAEYYNSIKNYSVMAFDFFERVFLHLCIWIKPPFGYMLFAQLCIDLLCNTLGERNNLFLVCLTQT
jgi:hypothetical protein